MSNYLANTNTKEIHRLSTVTSNCKIDEISVWYKKYLESESEVDDLIKNEDYDGCGYCYKEKHKK